jgi:hypothetical protein
MQAENFEMLQALGPAFVQQFPEIAIDLSPLDTATKKQMKDKIQQQLANQPPPVDPAAAKLKEVEQNGQIKAMELQQNGQIAMAELQQKGALATKEMEQEFALETMKQQREQEAKRQSNAADMAIATDRHQHEIAINYDRHEHEKAMTADKIAHESAAKAAGKEKEVQPVKQISEALTASFEKIADKMAGAAEAPRKVTIQRDAHGKITGASVQPVAQ